MRYIKWSDNICTVGHTCICGQLTARDMRWLLQMQPAGTFTRCFYEPRVPDWHRISPNMHVRLYGDSHRTYYFNFPEDDKGTALLVALRLKGLIHERGEH